MLIFFCAFLAGIFAERYLHLSDRIIEAAKWIWAKVNTH